MVNNAVVRLASNNEIGEVLFLFELFSDETDFNFSWMLEKEDAVSVGEDLIEQWITNPSCGHIIVCSRDGRIIGAMGHGKIKKDSDIAYDLFSYVLPKYRNAGVASSMHRFAGSIVKNLDVSKIISSVNEGNNHLDILIKTGFTPRSIILEKIV